MKMMTKEKDKSRSSRFSRQIKQLQQPAAGDSVTRDKPKKGRIIKRLSAVNKASSSFEGFPSSIIMGIKNNTEVSTPVITPATLSRASGNNKSKRLKLPKKLLDVSNGVGHSTVPRKLRSAMKKRIHESLSPPLTDRQKLLNPAIGSEESNEDRGFKRSRLGLKQENICGLITKDEEEVAETLYALAGMFPNAHSDASPSILKEEDSESPAPAIKEDSNSVSGSRTDEPANPTSNVYKSAKEADVCNGKILTEKFVKLGCQVNIDSTPVAEPENQKLICKPTNVFIPLGPAFDFEKQKPITMPDNWFLTSPLGQLDKQLPVNEPNKNGLALWPGLSSAVSNGTSSHGSSMLCSPAKVPAWLDAAVSASKVRDRRSWKRSTTHVCIGRLIQSLQTLEKKDMLGWQTPQLQSHEMLKPAVLMTLNEIHGMRKGFNGAAASTSLKEVRGSILQRRRNHHDQPHASVLPSVTYNTQEQSFNFMSLLQANSSFNGVETLSSKPGVSYLEQRIQHPTIIMPSIVHQPHHALSSSYHDRTQLQPTTYLGRPLYPPNLTTTTMSSTQLQHQQQQQEQIQQSQYLAAQYRAAGASTMIHLSSWQNRKKETPAMPAYVRAIIPRPPLSLEMGSPKLHLEHTALKQQQHDHHQLLSLTSLSLPQATLSLPHARVKRLQDHGFSSVFEDTERELRPNDAALPLQLLCNERM